MPHQRRGPKEWKPGMRPGIVPDPASSPSNPTDFRLHFVRRIGALDEVPPDGDFRSNAGRALRLGDEVQHWTFEEWRGGKRRRKRAGDILWFPGNRAAGIVYWPAEYRAEWTDADNPLDALSRWVWGEMTDEEEGGGER